MREHLRAVTDTFVLERQYKADPVKVYAAWAAPEVKAIWFRGGDDWRETMRSLDLRVGGHEVLEGLLTKIGSVTLFSAIYHDVVPGRRLVYSYSMFRDARLLSVSLSTVEFLPEGAGTHLVYTEQASYLDGFEDGGGRMRGTSLHLDRLDVLLADTVTTTQ